MQIGFAFAARKQHLLDTSTRQTKFIQAIEFEGESKLILFADSQWRPYADIM